jgi:hypothetical protein
MIRHEASPLQQLPANQARHAKREISGPLDKRLRNRLLRRNPKYSAKQYQTAFLRSLCVPKTSFGQ